MKSSKKPKIKFDDRYLVKDENERRKLLKARKCPCFICTSNFNESLF